MASTRPGAAVLSRRLDGIDLDEPIDGLLVDVGVVGARRRILWGSR